ncbi:MAG: VWA domain-containing protein [Vicinamibacterales bacterium]
MRRLTSFVVSLGLLLSIAVAAGQEQAPASQDPAKSPSSTQQPPVFRTEANFVRVDAYPTKDGRPVQGLTAADFEIFEDGAPQKIVSFEHVRISTGTAPDARIEPNSVREAERMAANPRNRVFVVYLDVPHVQVEGSHHIKEPLIRLLSRMMGPDDLVAVMTPLMSSTHITFGRKTDVIEQQLRENWPWGMRERLVPMDDHETQYELCYAFDQEILAEMKARRRERLVLESLHEMVQYLAGIREERKAIIVVTEGWQLYTPNPSLMKMGSDQRVPGEDRIGVGPDGRLRRNPATTRTENISSKYECDTERVTLASIDDERYFREFLDVANKANASFYPIDPRGLPVFDDSMGPGRPLTPVASQARLKYKLENLRTLADNTDGLAILNNNDLDKGMKRISDDLTSYYLLGYYSGNTKLDGGFRRLQVRVKSPGVSVRARRGYRAARAAEIAAAKAVATAPAPPGATALGNALAELARTRQDTPFVLRASAATTQGSSEVNGVWIAGELVGGKDAPQGGAATIEVSGGGISVSAKAELKPGERAFLIRVPLSKSLSDVDVRARFTPVGPPGTLPFTYTTRVTAPTGLPEPLMFRRGVSTANRLQPAASAQFARSDRLRLEVPVAVNDTLGAGRLLDKNGTASPVPVTISERTDATSAQRWLVADIVLAPLGAGDYVVELSAPSGTTERKVMTAIRVTR